MFPYNMQQSHPQMGCYLERVPTPSTCAGVEFVCIISSSPRTKTKKPRAQISVVRHHHFSHPRGGACNVQRSKGRLRTCTSDHKTRISLRKSTRRKNTPLISYSMGARWAKQRKPLNAFASWYPGPSSTPCAHQRGGRSRVFASHARTRTEGDSCSNFARIRTGTAAPTHTHSRLYTTRDVLILPSSVLASSGGGCYFYA